MKRSRALPWALALLDDGLRLYRRHVASFLAIGSVVLVPMSLLGLLFSTLVRTQLGEDWTTLGGLIQSTLQYPIVLYACLALSRTAANLLDGQHVRLRSVLRLGPLRVVGMGCYGLVLTAISGTFGSIVVVSVACPLLYAMLFGAGFLGSLGGGGMLGAAGSVFGVIFSLIFLSTLLLSSAVFVIMAYSVQAFALERRSIASSMSRSLDLLLFHFGRNLLVFIGAGAIIGTLLVAYSGTIFAGGAGLLELLDIQLAPITRDALISAVGTATWVVLLPPLPIWMSMLHRALAKERDADDLVAAVAQWRKTTVIRDA
jgi:hypothetical protein